MGPLDAQQMVSSHVHQNLRFLAIAMAGGDFGFVGTDRTTSKAPIATVGKSRTRFVEDHNEVRPIISSVQEQPLLPQEVTDFAISLNWVPRHKRVLKGHQLRPFLLLQEICY